MQATTTAPLFAARLRPARSYGTAGGWLGLVLAGIVGAPFAIAIPQLLLPGGVAYGLAAAGLIAYSVQQERRGRHYQQINLWPDQLEIVEASAGQAPVMQRFAPSSVRLRLVRDSFERTTAIFLHHAEGELELGQLLSRDEKSSFARAFGKALRQARRGA